jgi:predicted Zn finger-like uncharacterized protein
MIASGAQSLIIECPHCATRYQLSSEALGAAGRKVQCAACGEAWRVNPPPARPALYDAIETLVDDASERVLDDAIEREDKSAGRPRGEGTRWAEETEAAARSLADIRDALGETARAPREPFVAPSRAFARRLAAINRQLPTARLRRAVRAAALAILVALVGGLYFGRVEIVRQFPEMAGPYGALGLPVNVVGLEFHDLATELSRSEGTRTLRISARIVSTASRRVPVPPVVVSLLGADRQTLYRWSVTPSGRDLAPGEFTSLASQITTPPPGVTAVRLTFADGRSIGEASPSTKADREGS